MKKEDLYYLDLDEYDQGIVLNSLYGMSKEMAAQGEDSLPVNKLILKIGHAPNKEFRTIEKSSHDAR